MVRSTYERLHRLWETHELHMEVAVGVLAGVLLVVLLATIPSISHSPSILLERTPPLGMDASPVKTPIDTSAPTAPVSIGAHTSLPDESNERAQIEQDLTKTTREISEIQQSSLAITALIQKECGGQTNDCAKKLQSSLEGNATAYNRAQERLRALTASLGNLE